MFQHGEYVEVFCNGNWIVARVRRIVGDMIEARRKDGFIWLGVIEYVKPIL